MHCAGGLAMLAAAVDGAGRDARVLAVTVLTSLDAAALAEVGTCTSSVEELVVRRALVARAAGCAGVVASPLEAAAIRAAVGPDMLIVTPGVRSTVAAPKSGSISNSAPMQASKPKGRASPLKLVRSSLSRRTA